jgi:hypothetical protein
MMLGMMPVDGIVVLKPCTHGLDDPAALGRSVPRRLKQRDERVSAVLS